jgi:KTSC domain
MPSLAIRAFAYDPDRNELTVTFTGGRAYVYALVPPAVAKAFTDCGSKGAFHNLHIRDRYPFRKVKMESVEESQPSLREALVDSVATDGDVETAATLLPPARWQ